MEYWPGQNKMGQILMLIGAEYQSESGSKGTRGKQ